MYTARTHVKYSIKVGVGGRDSGSLLLPWPNHHSHLCAEVEYRTVCRAHIFECLSHSDNGVNFQGEFWRNWHDHWDDERLKRVTQGKNCHKCPCTCHGDINLDLGTYIWETGIFLRSSYNGQTLSRESYTARDDSCTRTCTIWHKFCMQLKN